MAYLILPDQNWAKPAADASPVVPASALNDVASSASDTQMTVAGDRAPLRVLYGRVRVGAQIANVVPYNGQWVVQVVWGEGPIDSVESVWLNDEAFAGTVTHYLGTSGQTVNSTLVAAFAQNSITYSDALPNIAYSVFVLPPETPSPNLAAIIKGRKVYDQRDTLTDWSDNPALALADFLTSTTYGLGLTMDWSSVTTVANVCDGLVSGAKRRTFGLAIDTVQDTRAWVETLRTYAGCWVVIDGANAKLVADRPRATDKTVLHASGHIARLSKITKRGTANLPNRVEIRYTDTSATPWRDASVLSPSMGLATGIPDSQVALPGIQNASQAYREAVERLNKLWLCDLSVEYELFDDGLAVEVGDVHALTHPIGLSAKPLRVLGVENDYGRFKLQCLEYDPAVYSDAVATDPTYPDTNLPSPADPPIPTGLTLSEVQNQRTDGTWGTAINVTWSSASFSYLASYRVEVWESGSLVDAATVATSSYRTPIVQDGKTYTVKVATISSIGASSAWASNSLTALGVYLPPDPVSSGSFRAYEAGGTVYLSWSAAADAWRYRVKRGTTSQTYAQATTIDMVDGLRLIDKSAPAGTFRYWVESVDSVGVESGNPCSTDVTVTLDNSSYFVDAYDQTSPTLSNMLEYAANRYDGIRHFVSSDGVSWNSKFTGAMSGYTSPLYSYFATAASSWTGESEDFGQSLSGNWTATATAEAIAGSISSELQLSADGTTWAGQGAMTAKATSRFGRIKHSAAASSSLHVLIPTQSIRLDVIPREESFSGTSSASGPVRVQLQNTYASAVHVTAAIQASAARTWTYDTLLLAPVTGLQFQLTVNSGGSSYSYRRISTAARTIASGDYLEYDVFVVKSSNLSSNQVGGFEMDFSDASVGRSYGLSDSYGSMYAASLPLGQWVHRKVSLTAVVGKSVTSWDVVVEQDTAGNCAAVYKNIKVTDGAGTTRLSIYGTSGEPSANADAYSLAVSNVACGPTNTLQMYVFDDTNTKVANAFTGTFKGV